jgi:hypothetical protein
MFRKDRGRPVTVTEYLSECRRGTEPWKMQHRMLRHKALIQAARYAFGFSGIYDEDEGEKIAEMRDVTPQDEPPAPPPAPQAVQKQIEAPAETEAEDGIVPFIAAKLVAATSVEELNEVWDNNVMPIEKDLFPNDQDTLTSCRYSASERRNWHEPSADHTLRPPSKSEPSFQRRRCAKPTSGRKAMRGDIAKRRALLRRGHPQEAF